MLGSLADQRGTNVLGPIPRDSDRVAVYVRCRGWGSIEVTLDGVATFTNACSEDPEDLGVRNVLDVRYVSDLRLTLSGDNSLVWAAAITVPLD